MNESEKQSHGPVYWFCFHLSAKARTFAEKHRRTIRVCGWLLCFSIFMLRALIQWIFVDIRRYFFPLLLLLLLVGVVCVLFRRRSKTAKLSFLFSVVLLLLLLVVGIDLYDYLSLYDYYQHLSPTELTTLPVSAHERIQPQNSIFALAHDAVTESESPSVPDFVRAGNEYRWAIAIEPSYPIPRTLRGVNELFNIPGTTAAPTFSATSRVPVQFETGEHLMFSRNAHTATVRSFGLDRFINYEAAEVTYFPDDNGVWVQAVSLIRWRGFLFPRPEFGGVQIIRQQRETFLNYLKLLFAGAGEWIPPEDVSKYPFLRGQNVLSKKISRRIAESFRFQNGFFAPFPGYHDGDIRLPQLESDVNPQPFVGYFKQANENEGLLYHYFALEPYDVEKQGLNTSVFVPADGSGRAYVFRHYRQGGTLSGVSSIATKVMESRKDYDWNRNRPVEHRPFIREIDGHIRFFWLTTVVTARLGIEKGRFIAGSLPDVVITDASYNTPIWVNPRDPDTWVEQIKTEMNLQWSQK